MKRRRCWCRCRPKAPGPSQMSSRLPPPATSLKKCFVTFPFPSWLWSTWVPILSRWRHRRAPPISKRRDRLPGRPASTGSLLQTTCLGLAEDNKLDCALVCCCMTQNRLAQIVLYRCRLQGLPGVLATDRKAKAQRSHWRRRARMEEAGNSNGRSRIRTSRSRCSSPRRNHNNLPLRLQPEAMIQKPRCIFPF